MMKRYFFFLLVTVVFVLLTDSCSKETFQAESARIRVKTYDASAFDYIFVEAIKQKLLGNSGDALKYFEQCLKINPNSDAVYFHMAQIVDRKSVV